MKLLFDENLSPQLVRLLKISFLIRFMFAMLG